MPDIVWRNKAHVCLPLVGPSVIGSTKLQPIAQVHPLLQRSAYARKKLRIVDPAVLKTWTKTSLDCVCAGCPCFVKQDMIVESNLLPCGEGDLSIWLAFTNLSSHGINRDDIGDGMFVESNLPCGGGAVSIWLVFTNIASRGFSGAVGSNPFDLALSTLPSRREPTSDRIWLTCRARNKYCAIAMVVAAATVCHLMIGLSPGGAGGD